ncbi:mechanosensitive ion channel family protein [Nakamurella aerolata]
MLHAAAPDCAAELGSWCQRIWSSTGMGWLAANIDTIGRRVLAIVVIVIAAVVVRYLAHRAITKVTTVTATGKVPKLLRPIKERADVIILGPRGVARRTQRAESIGGLLKSIASFVIVTIAIILILAELGINVGPILASAGIAGVAIGFGAQNLVKDFLSGIFMLLEDQYGVGDVVDLGPASGTVIDVGLRITTLRSVDGTIWYVRNGEVLRVGNSSQGESVVIIDLPLSYRADANKAAEIALATATEVAKSDEFADVVIKMPESQGVLTMTSDAVTIRLVATVRAGEQWAFGRAVRGAIKQAFDLAGIQSPASDLRYLAGRPGSGTDPGSTAQQPPETR